LSEHYTNEDCFFVLCDESIDSSTVCHERRYSYVIADAGIYTQLVLSDIKACNECQWCH